MENKDGLIPALAFTRRVGYARLCLFSEVYDFQILLRVPCLWFRHSFALTLILAFASCCLGGEVKLEVWKRSSEAPDQFPRSVHEPGAAQSGLAVLGFHLPGKEL